MYFAIESQDWRQKSTTYGIMAVINTKTFPKLSEDQRTVFFELEMAWKIFSAKKYVRHGLKPILFFTRQSREKEF